ncbi:transmembrane protein 200C-like [Toxotes jaculatrix]|uniref:transmembrane protein 200C-like n=1 Tax=Toxotes jaculatrix TaxID=941984 RepID=UPI001B3AE02D|nr:transmembrane protein 200C-like [Toxotes jaculatrix]
MIATGGLLRINARRQDSLRSKPHKPHSHKRKNKKKRRSEVVVVKGKLKLCSVSGLVAALGIVVLLVGVVMAALGYWPRDGLFFSTQPPEAAAMASVSSMSSTPAPADSQGGETGEELRGGEGDDRGKGEDEDEGGGGDENFNWTEAVNGTTRQVPRGFLENFLDRYLYSDRLKVFGPLIMGIGIFLFICANAVLHENRDKKTKVINLRDIYSTVIDLHSLRRPNTTSSCSFRHSSANPLNGLVNYVQSKSLESRHRAYPASLLTKREEGGGEAGGGVLSRQQLCGSSRGGGGGSDGGGDTVFSIYKEQPDVPLTPIFSSSHRLSPPPSFSPPPLLTCWTSLQREELSSFTLPLRHPRPPTPRRRHSAWARMGRGWGEGGGGEEVQNERPPPPLCTSTPPPPRPFQEVPSGSYSSSSLHREAVVGSQALTQSLPTRSINPGYSKLMHGEDESFESTEITSSPQTAQVGGQRSEEVTSRRRYSNREKLRMISQMDPGLRQEEEG